MSAISKQVHHPLPTILPLAHLKRCAVFDAIDKCHGNRLLAARLLGIGKTTIYRMAGAQKSLARTTQRGGSLAAPLPSPFQR
jgi:DNA-binding NtrC family response regulator